MSIIKYLLLNVAVVGLAFSSTLLVAKESEDKNLIKILMLGGGDAHDYDKWFKGTDVATLSKDGFAEVRYLDDLDSIKYYLEYADVLYMTNNQPIKDPENRKAIMDFVDAGNGLVLGHAALWYSWSDWPEFNQKLVSGGSRSHDRYGNFDVNVVKKNHPVTKGVPAKFSLKDELYYQKIDPKGPGIEVLATATKEGSDVFPSVFVVNHPKSKIVSIALGHDNESHDLEAYKTLLKNAIKWTAE
ncbi:MAG TPA: ThuA domain-containing protein [Anditalea sp.]|nr:ThuA domain-containing protein [Anditalea sp.]